METTMLKSIYPATGELVAEYNYHTQAEVESIVSLVGQSQSEWSKSSFDVRKQLMFRVSELLRKKAGEYGRLITMEMGKPVRQSVAEVEKCAAVCDYYVKNAEKFLSREYISAGASESYIAFRPLGVVLAIMPWNFPFWQVFRFAAPALMAGNGILLKHASNVTGSALAIESLFREAGFPSDLFRTLKLSSSRIEGLIEHSIIKAVTITGSVNAGKAVAAKAGLELKKTVLELGGSDPYIILDDADLHTAVPTCINSRLINSGQSCIAAKRFIIVKSRLAEFERMFIAGMRAKTMGDPLDEKNDVGPQASTSLREDLHRQVEESIEKGAVCLLGGVIPEGKGSWYPPTVLTNVRPGMPAYDDEIFGPVAAIISAGDEEDAIRIANDTRFGLGASVFTSDLERGKLIAENQINAGSCFVNDQVRSDPRLPFGGLADSGYGRELSYPGIREFVNIKTVYVK
jgi:succinate-semialdehyde dehydrogenase / glutarate-semialdehyde dehydrogenase